MDQRGGGGGGGTGAHAMDPGNVFTILEIMYSGALRGKSMLRWIICEPSFN